MGTSFFSTWVSPFEQSLVLKSFEYPPFSHDYNQTAVMRVNSLANGQPRLDVEMRCAPLATQLLLVLDPPQIRGRICSGGISPPSPRTPLA